MVLIRQYRARRSTVELQYESAPFLWPNNQRHVRRAVKVAVVKIDVFQVQPAGAAQFVPTERVQSGHFGIIARNPQETVREAVQTFLGRGRNFSLVLTRERLENLEVNDTGFCVAEQQSRNGRG
jgi:hypothetical protein